MSGKLFYQFSKISEDEKKLMFLTMITYILKVACSAQGSFLVIAQDRAQGRQCNMRNFKQIPPPPPPIILKQKI